MRPLKLDCKTENRRSGEYWLTGVWADVSGSVSGNVSLIDVQG